MNTIANIVNPSTSQRSTRALAPVQESGHLKDQRPQQPAPSLPVVVAESMLDRLQVRAVILSREANPSGLYTRGREAVVAYKYLDSEEEREKISDLLGINEYA